MLLLTAAALVGALYMDDGMDAVANVLGDYVAYMARFDLSSGDADAFKDKNAYAQRDSRVFGLAVRNSCEAGESHMGLK